MPNCSNLQTDEQRIQVATTEQEGHEEFDLTNISGSESSRSATPTPSGPHGTPTHSGPNPPRAGRRQKLRAARPAGNKRKAKARDIWTFIEHNSDNKKRECIFCK